MAVLDCQDQTVTRAAASGLMGRTALRRLVRDGLWVAVTPGVYAAAPAVGTVHRLWAGHLLGGPGSALGGYAALSAAGVAVAVPVVAVWLPPGVRRAARPGFVFRVDGSGRLGRTVGTLPRIRLEEALMDVCGEGTIDDWVSLVSVCVRERKVSVARLREAASGRYRLPRRELVTEILADMAGVESSVEWRYLRDVEQAHGLPTAARQVSLVGGTRIDARYTEYGVIVELDGQCHLASDFRDMERDNAHTELGEASLRYGSVDLRTRACAVAGRAPACCAGAGGRVNTGGAPVARGEVCGAVGVRCAGEPASLEESGWSTDPNLPVSGRSRSWHRFSGRGRRW